MKKKFAIILTTVLLLFYLKLFAVDIFLPKFGNCVKAKITNQTMRLRYQRATYLYEFHVNGEDYANNSEIYVDSDSINIDSIYVVYLEIMPSINMRHSYFIERNRKMDCKCE